MKAQQLFRRTKLVILVAVLSIMLNLAGCKSIEPVAEEESPTPVPNEEQPTPAPSPTSTEVPAEEELPIPSRLVSALAAQGSAPVLDGAISPGEWDDASIVQYKDGSELMLMHADGVLYLAVRASAPEMIMANVFLQRGDEVSILHSSAALGTAKYAHSNGAWKLTQNFNWRCRDTGFSERAQAEREEFLQTDGWVAANSIMGTPNELEYQIISADEITAMAVIFVQELVPIPFPVELEDACVQTYPDGLPEELDFSVEEWVGLELVGD